jgi:hypothetical protein
MVNPARFLAAVGGQLQKRDDTTSWSSIISTSFLFVSEPTSVTVFGYYTTTRAVVDGSAVVSTLNYTTSTTASWATSPLTSTTSLDPSCSTGYSAYLEDLLFITDLTFGDPTFAVGYNEPCLPTGFGTVGYYSPGLCPSGYTVALERTFSSSKTNTRFLETQGICCFK